MKKSNTDTIPRVKDIILSHSKLCWTLSLSVCLFFDCFFMGGLCWAIVFVCLSGSLLGELMFGIAFVCYLWDLCFFGELCWALGLSVCWLGDLCLVLCLSGICGTYVGHWVCLFVCLFFVGIMLGIGFVCLLVG